jgi:hypothetical protein
MRKLVISVKEFNSNQDKLYTEYVQKCEDNQIKPEPQERYFPKVKVNYGFVYQAANNSYIWKKRKKDFSI